MKLARRVLLGSIAVIIAMSATSILLLQGALPQIAAAAGIGMIAAVGFSVHFARSVSKSVLELRDIARAMGDGDMTRRPAISAPGEIGDLGSALNRLSEQLAARLRALNDEEALVAAIIESLNEGVVTIGERRMVVRINSTARELLGIEEDLPFSFDHLPRDERLREAIARALDGYPTEKEEIELSGRELALEARPIDRGAVLAFFDLTALRRLETVRRDFVANASHELRTPLTVIRGFAEPLADKSLSEADRLRFASIILTNTERMQRIVDELLDLSRIEAGGWTPRPGRVDVSEVAAEVIAGLADRAKARNVRLTASLPEDARWLIADRTALLQILLNLVDNALRHTENGEVRIFSEAGPHGRVSVGVRDTGSGIAAHHLHRIFERFYRVDPARERSTGGVGLGLSIVKHLVEAHGGTVGAESSPGQGTTVFASFAGAVRDEFVT